MKKVIFGLFVFNCCYMAAAGFVLPILPLYVLEFGVDIVAIGPLWTAMSLISFVMAPLWGSISDKYGKRLFHVIAGTLISSLICVLYALATNLQQMIVLMILWAALGSSQAFPIFMTIVSELSGIEERGRVMGFFWMGGSVGWALSVSLSGQIIENLGIQKYFFVPTLLYLLSAFISKIIIDKRPEKVSRRDVDFIEAIKDFKWCSLTFIVFWLAAICFFISDSVKISYVLVFFERELGLDHALATLLLALTTWVEIPILPFFGSLSDKFGRKPLILLGLLSASLFNASISILQNSTQAVLIVPLSGISWAAFASAGSAFIGDLVEEKNRAKAMSLYNSSGSIANVIAPSLMSIVILKTSFRAAFQFIALILFAGFLLILIGLRRRELR
ncbi:MAG: MFS transporter [Candidatus Bathyarchaeia archaeon]